MITPWKVSGEVNYDKILKEFGAERLDEKTLNRLKKPILPMIKRGLFFAHRDFDKFIDSYERGEKIAILTGRGPSGKMHIAHLIPFMVAKWFQDKYDADVIIPISDDEKFYVNKNLSYDEVRKFAIDNAKSILGLGFKKEKTKVIIDFEDTQIYRFAARIAKRITLSTARAVYGIKNEMNIGWVFYPAVNVAHILLPDLLGYDATLVPIGIDQDPHVKLSRDIANKMKLNKPAALLSKFIPSLIGESKMSASVGNAIWLDDSKEEIYSKLMKYTITGGRETAEEQRKKGGVPDRCVVFQYLKYIFEESDEKLSERREKCIHGEILCGECKKYLADKISEFLYRLQKRKQEINLEDYKLNSIIP